MHMEKIQSFVDYQARIQGGGAWLRTTLLFKLHKFGQLIRRKIIEMW